MSTGAIKYHGSMPPPPNRAAAPTVTGAKIGIATKPVTVATGNGTANGNVQNRSTVPPVPASAPAPATTTAAATITDGPGGDKKRKIALIANGDDALQRMPAGDSVKRPTPRNGGQQHKPFDTTAPPPPKLSSSVTAAATTDTNSGATPAERAMQRSRKAADSMTLAQYNVIKHFVVLGKLLQQSVANAVVAESAADLARSGQY